MDDSVIHRRTKANLNENTAQLLFDTTIIYYIVMVSRRKKQSFNEDTAQLLFDIIRVYSYIVIYCDGIKKEKKSGR